MSDDPARAASADDEPGGGPGVPVPEHPGADADLIIERMLRAVREHLGLDVAFVGEFVDGHRVFRYVDAKPTVDAVVVGGSDPLEETYCQLVVEGRLPQLLVDPAEHPVAASLPVTHALPVGSHLSVPIRFSDGRTFGTFCCFGLGVERSLTPSDLRGMRMLAELASEYLEAIDAGQADQRRRRELIRSILDDPTALTMVFQPLRDVDTLQIVALEALARFPGHRRGPAWFFPEAAKVGLDLELEMQAVRVALDAIPRIPAPIRLNVNVSPSTLYSEAFFQLVADVAPGRLVVEVTEHAAIVDYTDLRAAAERCRELGVALAIDDVGMGFSGLNRILESAPQDLKLDAAVIRGVDACPVRQALIHAFCSFGERTGFDIVAEGIETAAELDTVRSLGIRTAQGYHLGRPGPLAQVLSDARAAPPAD